MTRQSANAKDAQPDAPGPDGSKALVPQGVPGCANVDDIVQEPDGQPHRLGEPVPVEIRPFAEGALHERNEVDAAQVAGAVGLHGDLAADVDSAYLHAVVLRWSIPVARCPRTSTPGSAEAHAD